MSFWDKFLVCNILVIILLWRLHYIVAFPDSDIANWCSYIITIISFCLIVFDIFYIILKIILKVSKNVRELHMINKNNDD